ncbi:phosphopentomutase [Neobacillus pocheonensis]|uniref:Phosphopentomutase n=1 Tax=Neobacillus pocheonensis TaxID=363869 RepID=A0ABT0WAG0_9BACI|nr:phosphopentomutase [Neobacillus pocheonensis]
MRRITLLVLDGFGVGAMEDCKKIKPEDVNANTYKHIRETIDLTIPTLYELGLGKIVDHVGEPKAAYGKSNLAHPGADTFMGHQELMGSKPGVPNKRLLKDVGPNIKHVLETKGYEVVYPVQGATVLLVNGSVVIGDNLESQVGNIINVVGDLNRLSWEELTKIGKIVRENVDTSRVIVFGNKKSNIEIILSVVKQKNSVQWGVDAPKANVYGEGYHVLHLGFGVDFEKQFAHMAELNHIPVYRIGKTADVIQANGYKDPVVNTKEVLETYRELYRKSEDNAVFLVNVQETDLAGHKEDSDWYKEVLEESDQFFASFIPELSEQDVLIITADHGNDPTIGHSNHTREQTPILIVGKNIKPVSIGTRETMADIAATMAEFVGIERPEFGTSFLKEIL